jgi:hypothetical protein
LKSTAKNLVLEGGAYDSGGKFYGCDEGVEVVSVIHK